MTQPRDFGFGEEQVMLQEAARRFCEDKQPLTKLREATAGTEDPYHGENRPGFYDPKAWDEMIALGWTALAVPESAGGVGMSLVTATALAEEIGRASMPTPLTSTLQTTYVLKEAATPGAEEWLTKIAEGQAASLAIQARDGSHLPESTEVFVKDGKLFGTTNFVQDLQKADLLVTSAKEDGITKLYAIESSANGLTMHFDKIVDLTRDQGRVSFDGAKAECISEEGTNAITKAMPAIYTLIAADIAGGCEWLLQSTAEYASVRTQFDRPIGFFQAVKHPIVDMMIAADETRSLVYSAACAYDTEPEKAQLAAHLAKSSAADSAEFCSNRATQLHGGIGFTWEHNVQIYHKRQLHSKQLYGDAIWHREQAAIYL